MSDQPKDERTLLKERADQIGLEYPENIPTVKLKALLVDALKTTQGLDAMDAAELERERILKLKRDMNQLVRVRITNMDGNKRDWPGEIITVGNSVLGTVSKLIPFNAEDGWHVPRMMLDTLKERKYQQFYTVTTKNGQAVTRTRLVPALSIQELPPLTPEELESLNAYIKATQSDDELEQPISGGRE